MGIHTCSYIYITLTTTLFTDTGQHWVLASTDFSPEVNEGIIVLQLYQKHCKATHHGQKLIDNEAFMSPQCTRLK